LFWSLLRSARGRYILWFVKQPTLSVKPATNSAILSIGTGLLLASFLKNNDWVTPSFIAAVCFGMGDSAFNTQVSLFIF